MVDSISNIPGARAVSATARHGAAAQSASPGAAPSLSGESRAGVPMRTMALVAAIVDQGPPVDADRVAELRDAIAQGRYAPDPHRIAEAMLAFGRDDA